MWRGLGGVALVVLVPVVVLADVVLVVVSLAARLGSCSGPSDGCSHR